MGKKGKESSWDSPGQYTPCGIGGQALLEGIMMRGKTSVAIACRDEKGRIAVSFFHSMVDGVKYIGKSSEIYAGDDDDAKLGSFGMALAVVLSLVLAIGLFVALPKLIHWVIWDVIVNLNSLVDNSVYILIISLTDGVIKILVLVLYMLSVARVPDIRRTFMYHGGEHRTISCYEHNLDLTVENVQSCSTRHARCGTTFLLYTLVISIIVITVVLWLLSLTGYSATAMQELSGNEFLGTFLYNLINIGVSVLCIPLMAGLSYELLKGVAKAPDNWFTKILKAPGFMLQALTTRIPDDEMAEVAIAAFNRVLEMDADPSVISLDFYEMTYKDAKKYVEDKYTEAGIDDKSEVDWALCNAIGCERQELGHVEKLNRSESEKLMAIVESRVTGIPLDYITGESFFRTNKLKVTKDVHLPRMETEIVAEKAIKLIKEKGYGSALDLMTGSGCIALALKTETDAEITASDISAEALAVAGDNFAGRVKCIESDVFSAVDGTFDIIVSNPPYIRSGEIETLAKEVQCQPRIALDGGEDGLKYYRIIAEEAMSHLNAGGALVLEIGHDQADDVSAILEKNGYSGIEVFKDLSGSDRGIAAFKEKAEE